MPHKTIHSPEKGMTLAEILVAVGIFTVIMAAVAVFESNVFSYNRVASGSFVTVQDAQAILKTMTRELRAASQGSDGSYAIQNAATNTVTFFADINGNGNKEKIVYTFSPAEHVIYKSVTTPSGVPATYLNSNTSTTTIIVNVRNDSGTPMFEYFDSNYNGSGAPMSHPVTTTSVRLIRINVTLDVNPNELPPPRTYSSQVTLRNLKDNL